MATTLTSLYKPKGSDKLSTFVSGMAANMAAIEKAYPVGHIWISVDKTSPASIVGGQWEPIGSGRVLVAAGFEDYGFSGENRIVMKGKDAGMTGGESRHSHLTAMGFDGDLMYAQWRDLTEDGRNPIFNSTIRGDAFGFNVKKTWDINHTQLRLAYTREQSSYPPYFTVWMWRRTG